MAAQKIETIKIQKIIEGTDETDTQMSLKDWLQLMSKFVTIGGDFAN